MRNLAEHPITADEVKEVLHALPMVNPPGTPPSEIRVGGHHDYLRYLIISYLERPEVMEHFLQEIKVGFTV